MPSAQTILGEKPIFSEKRVLSAIADALSAIKSEDGLTWDDVAAVLGVSDVQAAKYFDGSAKINIIAFARAKREWNGRFTGAFDRLCVDSRPTIENGRSAESKVLKAALALSIALEDDDAVTPKEVRQNRATLENARDAIDGLLATLKPRDVA